MPFLDVRCGNKHLASLPTDANNVVSVSIGGNVTEPGLASIHATAGMYEQSSESKHLIYLEDFAVSSADEVEISFVAESELRSEGKTISAIHGSTKPQQDKWKSEADIFDDVRNRPKTREGYSFQLHRSGREVVVANTEPGIFSFNLYTLWDWKHPETARISLSSVTLDEIQTRKGGTTHAAFRINIGETIIFRVQAYKHGNSPHT